MVAAVSDSPIDSLIKKNSQMAASTSDGSRVPLPNAYPMAPPQLAMRYLLQRSKRFDEDFDASPKHEDRDDDLDRSKRANDKDSDKERLIERLRYLGLAPRKYCTPERSSASKRKRCTPKKLPQTVVEDDEFVRPKTYPCDYCSKVFIYKIVHRRHTIEHLTVRRCANCNQPFDDKVCHRRHQANCKKRLHYKTYAKKMYEF